MFPNENLFFLKSEKKKLEDFQTLQGILLIFYSEYFILLAFDFSPLLMNVAKKELQSNTNIHYNNGIQQ